MRDYEGHPAWGMIGAFRTSVSPPGAALFDSDIRHQHTVMVRIEHAERKRDLHSDWIMATGPRIIEIEMSEAQWASFISSMNTSGVPCTLRSIEGKDVPRVDYAPRLEQSMLETRRAADEAFGDIQDAMAAVEAASPGKERTEAMRTLRARIENAPANVEFAGRSLAEHAENVVSKARADIEAMVLQHSERLGLETAPAVPQLEAGPPPVPKEGGKL